jgi:glycosyltransferase involved in cell wall biosynthesis
MGETPLKVIGKPYSQSDPYFLRFLDAVRDSNGVVEYLGPMNAPAELASRLRKARGFVLPSTMETQSLAALEAAAAGLPLLLSDLPWAHVTFGRIASYLPLCSQTLFADLLKTFFDAALHLQTPPKPPTWQEVAHKFLNIYRAVTTP